MSNRRIFIGMALSVSMWLVLMIVYVRHQVQRDSQDVNFIENHSEIKVDTDFIMATYHEVEIRHDSTVSRGRETEAKVVRYVIDHNDDEAYKLALLMHTYWYPLDKKQRDTMDMLLKQVGIKLVYK